MSVEAATASPTFWPASYMHMTGIETGAGTAAVFAAGYSGLEIVGTVGGILSGIAAIIALVLSVSAGNAKRRRQYDSDIKAAEDRGHQVALDAAEAELIELREIRTRYYNLLEAQRRPRGGS